MWEGGEVGVRGKLFLCATQRKCQKSCMEHAIAQRFEDEGWTKTKCSIIFVKRERVKVFNTF
jgi:hypothetical protein